MLTGHGNDSYFYKDKIKVDFSSNVIPGGPNAELVDELKSHLKKVANYPEPNAESFIQALAQKYMLPSECFLATNGATEAFYLIAQAYRGASSQIIVPTFSEYEDACTIMEHQLEFVNWDEMHHKETFNAGLVWICNPNNPTGDVVSAVLLQSWIIKNPDTLFVIDEAYEDMCPAPTSIISFIKEHPNVLVVRSLTKCYAIAGLRLGFMVGNEELIAKIKAFKMPWNVNSIAVEAGKWALSEIHNVKYDFWEESLRVQELLNAIPGIEVRSSSASYFLIRLIDKKAADLKQFLIDKYGLLIRDASNFRGLTEEYVRIAVQNSKANDVLVNAIKEWSSL